MALTLKKIHGISDVFHQTKDSATMGTDTTKTFLTHMNGIRALAIVLVVLYHLDSRLCPCGYFGVDVFLIISGYFLFSKELQADRLEKQEYGKYLLRKRVAFGTTDAVCGDTRLRTRGVCFAPGFVLDGTANPDILLRRWQ